MIQSQRFFNKVSSHYQDFIEKGESLNFIDASKDIIEAWIGGRVLDVGNGGVRRFHPPQTTLYVGVDFSLEMLKKGKNRTYDKVCGEALNLPFKEGGFDTILYFYLLHHLAQGSIRATNEAVKKALSEGSICLKKGGNVIITETCLPSFLEKVERAFFFILRILFFLTKQSEVFLFSAETFTRILTKCGYKEIRTWKAYREVDSPWKWVPISIGFPTLKIPRWMNPSRVMIFEART
jgi:ubiquinone/menaquinone biosynthesis C-methylase UbiE